MTLIPVQLSPSPIPKSTPTSDVGHAIVVTCITSPPHVLHFHFHSRSIPRQPQSSKAQTITIWPSTMIPIIISFHSSNRRSEHCFRHCLPCPNFFFVSLCTYTRIYKFFFRFFFSLPSLLDSAGLSLSKARSAGKCAAITPYFFERERRVVPIRRQYIAYTIVVCQYSMIKLDFMFFGSFFNPDSAFVLFLLFSLFRLSY